MPRILGLIPSTEELPFAQGFAYMGLGVVGNNSSAYIAAGSFQMPFDGELFAHYTVVYSWSGGAHQHVYCAFYGSSPAPNAATQFNAIQYKAGSLRGQIPVHGYWTNLVKNQVVTLNLLCGVGGGGVNVNFEVASGTVRASRVGL